MELSQSIRSAIRRATELALAEERRSDGRTKLTCPVNIHWHHRPFELQSYEGLDCSETGLRIRTHNFLAEGLTGRATFSQAGIPTTRTVVLSWTRESKSTGNDVIWEAGLRLL
ncbi:MAG: hypothetical protein FJ285_06830 [Planctomycetes bacterium]|nr:hypothetical protein [Planctomycetota bacterium]